MINPLSSVSVKTNPYLYSQCENKPLILFNIVREKMKILNFLIFFFINSLIRMQVRQEHGYGGGEALLHVPVPGQQQGPLPVRHCHLQRLGHEQAPI